MIAAAADAVREGARFIATNIDPTFPTESGLLPGAGSLVAAIAAASGRGPEVAGKPHAPMRRLIEKAGVSDAWVIGDRLDTDIALASGHPDWRTIVVLTGVTGEEEAQGADVDFVVADFSRAVDVVLTALEGR
jgi:4-nitrophenyl phosphatase